MSTWVPIANKTQTFNAASLTVCSSKSWLGSFIAGTASYFSIKRCANPASNWATLTKLHCCPPKKQTASTVYVMLGFLGSWTRLSLPYNQKHSSLVTYFPIKSLAVLPNETSWWVRSHSRFRVHFPKATITSSVITNRVQWNLPPQLANDAFGKNTPGRCVRELHMSSILHDVTKSHAQKKKKNLSETWNQEECIWHKNNNSTSKKFFETLAKLSMIIHLFNSINIRK